MTVNRNDPCPCGSGRKYKQCCLNDDAVRLRALRPLLGEGVTPPDALVHVPAVVVRAMDEFSSWEVDALTVSPSSDDPSPGRPCVLLVVVDGHLLDARLDAAPPCEPLEIAEMLANFLRDAVHRHRTKSGAVLPTPEQLFVRHATVAHAWTDSLVRTAFAATAAERGSAAAEREDPSAERASATRTQVLTRTRLPGIDAIAMDAVPLADPSTWSAWRADNAAMVSLTAAASRCHAAAPWSRFRFNDGLLVSQSAAPVSDSIHAAPSALCSVLGVLGHGGQQRGIVLYECETDYASALRSDRPADELFGLDGAILTLYFDTKSALSRSMQQEFARNEWPVAADDAFPSLSVANSPAGGVSRAQWRLLTDALNALARMMAVPDLVADGSGLGNRSGKPSPSAPQLFADELTGLTIAYAGNLAPEAVALWDVAETLTSGAATGPSANPNATLARDGASDAEMQAQFAHELPRIERFREWIERTRDAAGMSTVDSTRGVRTRARASEARTRPLEDAQLFLEHLAYGHGVSIAAVHEYHLRIFLYAWFPENIPTAAREIGAVLSSLKQLFAFAAQEGIVCPWAHTILNDRVAIDARIASVAEAIRDDGAPEWWHEQLNIDLRQRVLLPAALVGDASTDDELADWSVPGEREAALYDELQPLTLRWREAAIADGTVAAESVRAHCLAEQRRWEATVHARYGKTPAAIVRQERKRGRRTPFDERL